MSYKRKEIDSQWDVSFRVAHAGDPAARDAVARLAALDSSTAPQAPYVIASVDGQPVAARSLASGATVADPFVRTADVLPLLALRASQLRAPAARGMRDRWRRVRVRPT